MISRKTWRWESGGRRYELGLFRPNRGGWTVGLGLEVEHAGRESTWYLTAGVVKAVLTVIG